MAYLINPPTLIAFDFEFTGLHQNTTPISVGLLEIVPSGSARQFEADFTDYNPDQVDEWVDKNVMPARSFRAAHPFVWQKENSTSMKAAAKDIASALYTWLSDFETPITMVGDVLAYDWILFRQIFGNDLPKNVSYIPVDISSMMYAAGIDQDVDRIAFSGMGAMFELGVNRHNAMADSLVIAQCYLRLAEMLNLGGGRHRASSSRPFVD